MNARLYPSTASTSQPILIAGARNSPKGRKRRRFQRTLPQISARAMGAERRRGGEFNHCEDRYPAEPRTRGRGKLDIAKARSVAGAR